MIKFSLKRVLKDSEDEPLTLEEKMHLVIREQSNSLKSSSAILGIIALILGFIVLGSWSNWGFLDGELTDEVLIKIKDTTQSITYFSIGLFGFVIFFYFLERYSSKKELKKYNELIDGFIRKSYLINFETAVPKGSTRVEKILNIALKVFPELKETEKKAKEKGKKFHYELNKEIGDFVYDLSLKTESGEFFLVKILEEQDFDELEAIVKNTNKKFEKDKIFRLICIGTDLAQIFTDHSVEEIMDDLTRSFKLDMIEEHEKGYFMAWID